ncbi:glutamine amidotransferase like class 1 domain containing 1 [Phyllostomus discolor]|uniref:Glutamine amidotransferase like class 1 domain containing 1 n=1 Tax=Phyllostomus discolor TaxID=89673 RepID=A0A834A5U3_9CHIR|nr:glutamine amidotransferase like class 1 domain containing 1 [Phyllostomus discolor]
MHHVALCPARPSPSTRRGVRLVLVSHGPRCCGPGVTVSPPRPPPACHPGSLWGRHCPPRPSPSRLGLPDPGGAPLPAALRVRAGQGPRLRPPAPRRGGLCEGRGCQLQRQRAGRGARRAGPPPRHRPERALHRPCRAEPALSLWQPEVTHRCPLGHPPARGCHHLQAAPESPEAAGRLGPAGTLPPCQPR